MSRIVRPVVALALVLSGAALAPSHACRLNSPALDMFLTVFCFILLPVLAYRVPNPRVAWAIVIAAPIITFGSTLLYIRVLHWDLFPSWLLGHNLSAERACRANLVQIQGAKAAWATEQHKTATDTPTDADLFGTNAFIRAKPMCPSDGTYSLGRVGERPSCSAKRHGL